MRHLAEVTIEEAGDNAGVYKSIIQHYQQMGDFEKLNAAYYCIAATRYKYALDGISIKNWDIIFSALDSLHKNKIKIPPASPILKKIWDSLELKIGKPSILDGDQIDDIVMKDPSLLIHNIDYAVKAWRTNRFSSNLSFDQFCSYILPYRIGTERLEDWRPKAYEEYKNFMDTIKSANRFLAVSKLNLEIRKKIAINHTMRLYPFDMTMSQMSKAKRGACRHMVYYTAMVMRSVGFPIGVDYAPLWGDLDKGHEWNTLLQDNGKMYPFDAAAAEFGGIDKYPYRFSKVFRMTFMPSSDKIPPKEDVPEFLFQAFGKDVTDEYTQTVNLKIPLSKEFAGKEKKVALLCTYKTRGWYPQDWGMIQNKKAIFKKIGTNILYIVMYYDNEKYYPATLPFILKESGDIQYITSDSGITHEMLLTRKYPYFPVNEANAQVLIGGRFQGANKPDFSDSVNLFTITNLPVKIEEVNITQPAAFRYVRYIAPIHHKTNLAGLEFWGDNSSKLYGKIIGAPAISPDLGTSIEKAMDNDLESYFSGVPDSLSWVGLDLGTVKQITRIRYCPRSDCNFIQPRDEYELRYWDGGLWKLFSKERAKDQRIVFTNVPAGKVYILHDLSKGREERIFTYENGKQIWW